MISLVATCAILTAIVAALMVFQSIGLTRAIYSRHQLGKRRDKQMAFSDLMTWGAVVADGVIVCKSGALMAAWSYRGEDLDSATDEDRNQVVDLINRAVQPLGAGYMLHIDAVRQEAPGYPERHRSHFPDAVCEAIDEERRAVFSQLGTLHETRYYITLTWLPPSVMESRAIKVLTEAEQGPRESARAQTQRLIDRFSLMCEQFDSRLSIAVKAKRLKGVPTYDEPTDTTIINDDFLRYLRFCLTAEDQSVRLPPVPMYIEQIFSQEVYTGFIPMIGGKYVQCITIEGFPSATYPGVLSRLLHLPIEFRWSNRFICLDKHQAIALAKTHQHKWGQKIHGFFYQYFHIGSSQVNQDAQNMASDAMDLTTEVESDSAAAGFYTSTIVLMHENLDQVKAAATEAMKVLAQLSFTARLETLNTMDAFLGSLPGNGYDNVRRPLITSLNLADLIPTNTMWAGEDKAPCPFYPVDSPPLMYAVTHGATPYRFNFHVHDVGHTFLFGPTGAGKSLHLALTAAQARRYERMTVFCFDKGRSMFPLAKAIWSATGGKDGMHHNIGVGHAQFAPLKYLDTPADLAWAAEWIDSILQLNGVTTTPQERVLIAETLRNLKATSDGRTPTITDFATLVSERLRSALHEYTVDGVMGHLLDGTDDSLSFTNFNVFELDELLKMGPRYVLPVLLYMFRRIEQALQGQPALIYIDEAWVAFAHEEFREKIREWLKTFRRANAAVVLATQSLSDAMNTNIVDVLMESCATKIFLPNRYADDPEIAKLYARMQLNEAQRQILKHAIPKRQYYMVSERGKRLYELAIQPLTLALLGPTDRDQLVRLDALIDKYGLGWLDAYLAEHHLSLAKYLPSREAA